MTGYRELRPPTRWLLKACADCLQYVANGDVPEDRADLPAAIADRLPARDGWQLLAGAAEQSVSFSHWPCSCCGSFLGGARHEVIALRETTPPT